jgi:hypothetical protein
MGDEFNIKIHEESEEASKPAGLMQAAELEVQGGALDVVIVARAGFLDLGGGLVQLRLA